MGMDHSHPGAKPSRDFCNKHLVTDFGLTKKYPKACENGACMSHMVQKVKIFHPSMSSPTVGGIMIKRVAPCKAVISKDGQKKLGEKCGSEFKVGACIDCKTLHNPCRWTDKWMLPPIGDATQEIYWKGLLKPKRGHPNKYWVPKSGNHHWGTGAKEYGCDSKWGWFRNSFHRKGYPHINPHGFQRAQFVPYGEVRNFRDHCIAKAFDKGLVKPEFKCSTKKKAGQSMSDEEIFQIALKTF